MNKTMDKHEIDPDLTEGQIAMIEETDKKLQNGTLVTYTVEEVIKQLEEKHAKLRV